MKKLRDHNKLVEDTLSIFKTGKKEIFTPPADAEYAKEKVTRFKKSDKVNVVHSESDTHDEKLMFLEDDESLAKALPPEEWDDDSKETSSESEESPTEASSFDRLADQPGKPCLLYTSPSPRD